MQADAAHPGIGRKGRKCPDFGGFLATSRSWTGGQWARARTLPRPIERPLCGGKASVRGPDGGSKWCFAHQVLKLNQGGLHGESGEQGGGEIRTG